MSGSIFFADIATNLGWCEGAPGQKPIFGSQRLAPEGSDSPALGAGLYKFVAGRFLAFKPRTFVYEAPRDPRHMGPKTNARTIRTLIGLPYVAEAAAYLCGVYDIREAEAASIRAYLLPKQKGEKRGRLDAGQLKQMVFRRICELGFDPKNTDEADAIAGWLFSCHQIAPGVAPYVDPLFAARVNKPAASELWEGGF